MIDDGAGGRVVERRRPPGPPPPGGHSIVREARVLQALEGGPIPVPRVLEVDPGGAFTLLEFVDGVAGTDVGPAADALVGTLAAIHALDVAALGLADLDEPQGDLADHLRAFAASAGDPAAARDELERLVATAPDPRPPVLMHGDFRLGNVLVDPDDPSRIAAVLDWELATIGDPLRDVGYLVACHPELAGRYAEVGALDWYVAMARWKLAVLSHTRVVP